jgi:hypothetical protein
VVRRDLGKENTLEEEIAHLLFQRAQIVTFNRLEHFVRFFEHERRERLQRLFAVPGAAFWRAQRSHDVDKSRKPISGRLRHDVSGM